MNEEGLSARNRQRMIKNHIYNLGNLIMRQHTTFISICAAAFIVVSIRNRKSTIEELNSLERKVWKNSCMILMLLI